MSEAENNWRIMALAFQGRAEAAEAKLSEVRKIAQRLLAAYNELQANRFPDVPDRVDEGDNIAHELDAALDGKV